MGRRIFSAVLVLLPAIAHAGPPGTGAIYKCVDARKHATYQNAPCGAAHRQAAVRLYFDAGPDAGVAARSAAIQREMDGRNRQSKTSRPAYRFAHPGPVRPEVLRCRAAKAERERVLDRVGLRRTFELLSRLDAQVWDACKHLPGV